MASTTCELIWLFSLLMDFQVYHPQAALLFCNSKVALHIAANLVFELTKHIELDCHIIRDKIQEGLICTLHISTQYQIEYIFTKALARGPFHLLKSKMNVLDISLHLEGEYRANFRLV